MENLAHVSSQPTSTTNLDNAPPTLSEHDETQQADEKVTAFMKFAYEELTNERDFFKNENMALRFKYLELEKTLEEQNVELDSKKAIENEIARLNQLNAELEAANKKYIDKISSLEKESLAVANARVKEKKSLESEITRVKQLNVILEIFNKKNVETIAVLEKQQEADRHVRDKEKKKFEGTQKVMQDEINRLNILVFECQASNKKHVETISVLEKRHEDNQKEKKTSEAQVAKMKQSHTPPQPLCLKKVVSNEFQNVWQCYSTLDGSKESGNLSLIDNKLLVNGVISEKQFILNGLLSQYEADPFIGKHRSYSYSRSDVSCLLKKVLSCNLTDLFLHNQTINLKEFEKLVSSRTIKNLYFDAVDFKDYEFDPVQKILENVPNIEKFAYIHNYNIIKSSNGNVFELPLFANLREFKIFNIFYRAFDVEDFVAFLTNHPNVRFDLSFKPIYDGDMAGFDKMKRMLESRGPTCKLQIQC